jgi:predicted amidophosphoribosyltransferase
LRNCRHCGKVFASASGDLCPSCFHAAEEDYNRIYNYLRDQPGAGVTQVSEGAGVPVARVLEFLRQGRIQLASGDLQCEVCGSPVQSGRVCERCRARLQTAGRTPGPKPDETTTERMYIVELERYKRERSK